MHVVVRSPYSNDALPWLKGNLHTHTANSDGPRSPQCTVDDYAERGYDFLMLSDHDHLTDPSTLDARGLTLVPGNEITAEGSHLLHVGARSVIAPDPDRQKVIDAIVAEGGFAVMCHPNWEKDFAHCPHDVLESLQGYAGIEIYNGIVSWLRGNPTATDRWDRLLGAGRKVWGFATDDCHIESDIGVAWNVVQSAGRDVASIVSALREGRSYASTGVTIERVSSHGATVSIQTKDAQAISLFSDYGFRRTIVESDSLTFTVPEDADYTYVRFECAGQGERRAWTQPLFIERVND